MSVDAQSIDSKNQTLIYDSNKTNKFLDPKEVPPITYYNNTHLDIIKISRDKLELYARDFEYGIKTTYDFKFFFGFAVTILLPIITADFKDNYGISGSTWRWIFTVILIISVYESVKKIPFLFKNALKFLSQFEIVSSLIPTKMIAEVFTITTPKDFVEICKNVKEDNKN